ncbi:MAG: TonB-dependent receptor [Bacteroidota bacterium]|nr:TonB-dependent receptor [Bacteroidota bacterium]
MLAAAGTGSAQDTLKAVLPTVEIQATRVFESTFSAARSVYVLNRDQTLTQPGLTLQQTLRGIPGIRITDRGHYGLGERVLVRGMGYRAAFGVRGLQAFLNGVPLTMPDGQSMLDVIDPAFIRRAELLRGPSSMYWGNAGGGVLFLSTLPDSSTMALRYVGGSYGLSHAMGSVALGGSTWDLGGYASRVSRKGYRAHSDGGFIRVGTTGQVRTGSSVISGVLNLAFQDVNSPGSLTAAQFAEDPRQANARFIALGAGKESVHALGGLSVRSQTALGTLAATAWYMTRRLENALTYAWIDLDRDAGGGYVQLHNSNGPISWSVGADSRRQHDRRQTFDNEAGQPRRDRVQLNQDETVTSLAAFAAAQVRLTPRLGLTGGTRIDAIAFSMADKALHNDNQSGSRSFTALSYSIGSRYRAQSLTLYGNFSTSFESPTTTEFINTPVLDGRFDGGFNPDLGPQRTSGLEAGIRGILPGMGLRLDMAGYHMRIKDRLVPRQSEEGRTWYQNAGRNRHRGVELAITWPLERRIQADMAYNLSLLKFVSQPDEGLRVPGIPVHHLQASIQIRTGRQWILEASAEYASDTFADQANLHRVKAYAAVDLQVARSSWQFGSWRVASFARIRNLFDHSYSGSLMVNAFGGRYFEPAARRSVQAGLGLSY